MMGRQDAHDKLFYSFRPGDRVPERHFLRTVLEVVDFEFIRELGRPYYSHTGTPSVDPVVVFKMGLLGYFYGITSERRLADECRLNMAFMWFLGYDIDQLTPDHSVLSKARVRFGLAVYQQVFSEVIRQCAEAGLIDGNQVFLDASFIRAAAAMSSLRDRCLWGQLAYSPQEYVAQVWTDNEPDDDGPGEGAAADTTSSQSVTASPEGEPNVKKQRANEKWVCTTDPDAALVTYNDHRGLFLAHKAHVAVDGNRAAIITAALTTPGDKAECQQVGQLLDQHRWNVRQSPSEVVADRGYGTIDVYRTCEQRRLMPSIRRRTPWKRERNRRRQAGFRYDPANDRYVCPQGKNLPRVHTRSDGTVIYRVSRGVCRRCPEQGRLCKAKTPVISHSRERQLLVWVDQHLQTAHARRSLKRRSHQVETVFAWMKGVAGLSRARLRGNTNVQLQVLMAATAYNISRLVKASKTGRPSNLTGASNQPYLQLALAA